MIKVLIADDHAVFREGLGRILSDASDIEVVGEAVDGASTIDLVRRTPADVIVLDLSMPGRSGIDLIAQVHRDVPQLKILVLTMHAEDQYALRAFRAGAVGYLTKEGAVKELEKAIRKAASGGTYMTQAVAELLIHNLGDPADRLLHQRLSDREFDIFVRLSKGDSLATIAHDLCISKKTVSTYKARILERMNLPNDVALVRYALTHGLV
ncbi:response regulator [Ralstonia sp. L16]|uniref:Response regulator UvrY n=1 Tax=Ralstonia wenshanensis TaxID=2842456 RepID=A0AAD2B7N9_9RALS|nr:response regulator transcription factor [Ralstonia wenshanensis]MCT7305452.1 response regulator transcription factor [Ralstonia wenshanensis]MDY7510284.1 response regulator transcription factor [Ralstonia wenshanensis]UGS88759.1 response regulator transcription factor [Ralstonia wenshanensis]CAJ0702975.1 Response regulator UvrY [Ralstonia wenshanensis]